jgi:hypothetical protein
MSAKAVIFCMGDKDLLRRWSKHWPLRQKSGQKQKNFKKLDFSY